jgi:hypothetical protein
MIFMIIERFGDLKLLRERFKRDGRMLPDNVRYQASWIDAATNRCYQVMEAPDAEALTAWIKAWDDIVDFQVSPVLTSQDFWAKFESEDFRVADQR